MPQGSAGSSPAVRTIALLLLALAGCSGGSDDRAIDVSAIGGAPRLLDPDRVALGPNDRLLADATTMGLVAFDAGGQVEPGIAESWIVTDDGLSTIFRIQRMRWPGGREVTSADVAASLNRALAKPSRNRLKPLLGAVEAVIGMTGRVVEVRLRVPRPNLLQLLAQPELGIRRKGVGLGPWTAINEGRGLVRLQPPERDAGPDDDAEARREIRVHGTRAAMAVARFMDERSNLVLGGTLADWPVAQVAQPRANRLRVDPAEGLFGLAAVGRRDFMKEPDLRDALSMAIDREALVQSFGIPRWRPADRLLPARLDSARPPVPPDWAATPIAERRATARARIAAWTASRGPLAPLKVSLPPGPGMRLLFALIAADWRTIGVDTVPSNAADADLRLIDEVAPNASANWYLTRTSCEAKLLCAPESDVALKESRAAPSFAERAFAIARADIAQANAAAFIPLARPVRWSLVDPSLDGFRENAFAVHPLAQLRVARR